MGISLAELSERTPELVARYEAGEEFRQIAEDIGASPLSVYQVISKSGTPLRPKKNGQPRGKQGAPRKARARVVQEQTYDLADGERIGVVNGDGATVSGGTQKPFLVGGTNLFPKRPPGEVDRIEVKRIFANPRHYGEGGVGSVDPEANEDVIRQRWGGGRYELRAWSFAGEMLARRTIDLPGRSIPFDPEGEAYEVEREETLYPRREEAGMFEKILAMQQQHNSELAAQNERISQERRELEKQRDQQQQNFFNAQLQQTQQFAQMQIQWAQTQLQAKSAPTSLLENLKTLEVLRSFADSHASESDPIMDLIKQVPAILGSVAEAKKAEAFVQASRVAPRGPQQQVQAAPHANPATPAQVAQQQAQGEEEFEDDDEEGEEGELDLEEIAEDYAQSLVAQGVPQEIAVKQALMGLQVAKSTVAQYAPTNGAHQNPAQPAAPESVAQGEGT